jgi:crotonobetainyl-CoA:carnitine CoA-transferase CaiB-like acyl-CoA transferase
MSSLEGIRVIDLTGYLAGPYCTMMLADLGAEVIKVEEPKTGDGSRQWGPPFLEGESAYFLSVNRNKKSIALNLKSKSGNKIIQKLVANSDVFIENYRPGIADNLGVGYEALKKVNPKLIYCSISGFGQNGPYKERSSYDIVGQAMGGIMGITGESNGGPVKVGIAIADICGGMFAGLGILAALIRRSKTGEGDRIDISLLDGQVSWLSYQAGYYFATGKNPERLGTSHPTIAPYQAFKASDSNFVVAVGNDALWVKFCDALSLDSLKADPRFARNPDRVKNKEELARILAEFFAKEKSKVWLSLLEKAGVPSAPIYSLDEVFKDPQVQFRHMVEEIDHPKLGRKIRMIGSPIKMSKSEFKIRLAPPTLGQNTEEILSSLGYSKDEIRNLKTENAI